MGLEIKHFSSFFELFAAFYFFYPGLQVFRNNFRDKQYSNSFDSLLSTQTWLLSITQDFSEYIEVAFIDKREIKNWIKASKSKRSQVSKIEKGVLNLVSTMRYLRLQKIKRARKLCSSVNDLYAAFEMRLSEIEQRKSTNESHESEPICIYMGLFSLFCLILAGFESAFPDIKKFLVALLATFLLLSAIALFLYLLFFFKKRKRGSTVELGAISTSIVFLFIVGCSILILYYDWGILKAPDTNLVIVCTLVFTIVPTIEMYIKPTARTFRLKVQTFLIETQIYFLFFTQRKAIRNLKNTKYQKSNDSFNHIRSSLN